MLQILFRWLELKIEIRRRLECVFYLILFSKKMEKWEKIGFFRSLDTRDLLVAGVQAGVPGYSVNLLFFTYWYFSSGHLRFSGRWCPNLNLAKISLSLSRALRIQTGGGVCLSACWDTTPPPWTRQAPPGPGGQSPPTAVHAGRYDQRVGGTHPTGMQSCWKVCS